MSGFCGTLATRVVQLRPFDPESKGIVERANGYLETSFLPGRTFTSPADFNAQLAKWLPLANFRTVRRTGARPEELIGLDRGAMLALPPVAPTTGIHTQVRLPRDYYVRVGSNDYCVDPAVIARMVNVHADLDTVTVTCDGRLVATHPRCWARGQTITDPSHVQIAQQLRQRILAPPAMGEDTLVRNLADYDTAFGVDLDAHQDAHQDADGQVA